MQFDLKINTSPPPKNHIKKQNQQNKKMKLDDLFDGILRLKGRCK